METNSTNTVNFSPNDTGYYNNGSLFDGDFSNTTDIYGTSGQYFGYDAYDGSLFDGDVSNTTDIYGNSSQYVGYDAYDDNNNYEQYTPTPDVTAIVLAFWGFVLLVGIVGNILVIIIIAAVKSMQTMVNKCLFSLALADLVILTMLPILPIQVEFTGAKWDIGKELCNFLVFYDRGAVTCSVLTFYYVSIDRYFALCYPLKSRALWTGRKTFVILVAIWIVSLALSYPYLYTSRYQEYYYNNAIHYFCYFDIVENKWMEWYDTSFGVFTVSLPIPVLLFLYGRMIYRIKRSVPKLNSGTTGNDVAGRRGRNQAVVMLLTVVVIYIVSQLPFAFLKLFNDHFPAVFSYYPFDKKVFTIVWISRILIYVNSAANPVIYFSLSTNFRQGFLQVFCCLRRKKSQSLQTRSSSL